MRENVTLILQQLDHPDPEIQSRASVMLVRMGAEGLEGLRSLIFSGNRDGYKYIPHLRKFQEEALPILKEILHSDSLLSADAAIRVLSDFSEMGEAILIDSLDYTSLLIRMNIIKALGESGVEAAVEPLKKLLQNCEVASVRYTIMDALIELDDESAYKDIISFADDPNPHVRERVQIARENLNTIREGDSRPS